MIEVIFEVGEGKTDTHTYPNTYNWARVSGFLNVQETVGEGDAKVIRLHACYIESRIICIRRKAE